MVNEQSCGVGGKDRGMRMDRVWRRHIWITNKLAATIAIAFYSFFFRGSDVARLDVQQGRACKKRSYGSASSAHKDRGVSNLCMDPRQFETQAALCMSAQKKDRLTRIAHTAQPCDPWMNRSLRFHGEPSRMFGKAHANNFSKMIAAHVWVATVRNACNVSCVSDGWKRIAP